MRIAFVALVLGMAGCDKVLGLEYRDPPDAAPDGHDEDGDGVADLDDNCPATKNGDQRNTMESDAGAEPDAVGDACDPFPTEAGDRIARFYPFVPEDQEAWDRLAGAWNFADDQLRYESDQDTNANLVERSAPLLLPPYQVVAHFVVDTVPSFSAFSITANLNSMNNGVACTLQRLANGTDEVQVYTPYVEETVIQAISAGAAFTATLRVTADRAFCNIVGDQSEHPGGAANVELDMPRPGRFGFEGHRMSARVDYLVVYSK